MKNIFTLCFLLITASVCAQDDVTPKGKEEINKACEQFMTAFKNGKFSDALSLLKQYSVIDHDAIDGLEATMKQQMKEAAPKYGKVLGFEFAKEKSFKNSVVNRYYLLKFERYYIRVTFTLYNNGSGWLITNFDYDDEIGDLME